MAGVVGKRVRRTPDQARQVVLDVAEKRLAEFGLDGLNIVDIAREAGMSHATLLHHFGSSDQMRRDLVVRMEEQLLAEIADVLVQEDGQIASQQQFMVRLFQLFSRGGHARLIAWMHVSGTAEQLNQGPGEEHRQALFNQVLGKLRDLLVAAGESVTAADTHARYIFLLVVTSALGFGVARDVLLTELNLDEDREADFALWLRDLLPMT